MRRLAEVFGLWGVERDLFNELAEPMEAALIAGAGAPAELAALREETRRLWAENEALRQVAASFARARIRPRWRPPARRGYQPPRATCRIFSLLLFGMLSLSPALVVVSHRPPSGAGSTVRSRP